MGLVSTQVTVLPGRRPGRAGRVWVGFALPLLVVLAGPASADESPVATPAPRVAPRAPAWPEALAQRNARYAVLTRVDDPEGEAHEALLAHAVTTRETDPASDLEELRRFVAAQRGHWATVEAKLARTLDLEGEREEQILARRTLARAHAQFARVRFPMVRDENGLLVHEAELELRRYERDSLRLDREGERLSVFATQNPDPAAERFSVMREHHRETASEAVREELRDELETDRALAIHEVRNEEREARTAEQADAKAEERADAEAEKDAERAEEKAEALAEREDEAATERATERSDERADESILERQMLQSEDGGL